MKDAICLDYVNRVSGASPITELGRQPLPL